MNVAACAGAVPVESAQVGGDHCEQDLLPGRRVPFFRRLTAALMIIAAVVTFGVSAYHEVQINAEVLSPNSVRAALQADAQMECIYRAIRAEVPEGAAFYTPHRIPNHYQRIVELSTLWAVPRVRQAQAKYEVILYNAPGHCEGRALAVRHL